MEEQKPKKSEERSSGSKIDISIQVAQISLSIAEITKLSEGTELEVDHLSNQDIKIMSEGRQIGSGEITRIGNMWGIRVRELLDKK